MNVCGVKHTNTEGLYLPRHKGGKGLRSVETTYKEIEVKAAVKLKRNKDPRMKLVNKFHQVHLHTTSHTLYLRNLQDTAWKKAYKVDVRRKRS